MLNAYLPLLCDFLLTASHEQVEGIAMAIFNAVGMWWVVLLLAPTVSRVVYELLVDPSWSTAYVAGDASTACWRLIIWAWPVVTVAAITKKLRVGPADGLLWFVMTGTWVRVTAELNHVLACWSTLASDSVLISHEYTVLAAGRLLPSGACCWLAAARSTAAAASRFAREAPILGVRNILGLRVALWGHQRPMQAITRRIRRNNVGGVQRVQR